MQAGGTPAQAQAYFALGHDTFRKLRDAHGPDLRVRQRRRDGRRPRARAALPLPHALRRRAGPRAARGLPRPGPRLGRQPAAAEPDRRRQGRHGHRRERAEPEPDAQGPSRPSSSASPTRCSSRPTSSSSRWSGPPAVVTRRDRPSSGPRSTAARPGTRRWPAAKGIADMKVHGAAPAPYQALELIELARTASYDDGIAAEDEALADLVMGEELRAGLYAFDLVQRRAKRPAGAPDKSLARDGHQGRRRRRRADGLASSRCCSRAARGAGRADRPRPGAGRQGRRLRARRDRQAARQGPDQPGQGQPAQGAGHRLDRQGGVRRRRLRHRGGVRGAGGQAAGLRRGRGGRLRRVRAGDQHLLAVGHRDGLRARAPRAGRRLPLLQPGRGAAAARDRPRRARPTTRRSPPRSRSARR